VQVQPTRRERLRERTIADIKAAALDQIRRSGAASLSLRAVAGALGMSPAGLYRYYDSRDALLTDLITDGFDAIAGAVARAGKAEPGVALGDRLLAASVAYRRWALAHRQEFGLIYGEPVPGYTVSEPDRTSRAAAGVGAAFLGLFAEAWAQGALPVPAWADRVAAADPGLSTCMTKYGMDLPPGGLVVALGAWARLHGLVMLEVFGHFGAMMEDPDSLFVETLRAQLDQLGLPHAGAGR
jgi:AcrR family transcriptional regulator